MTGADLVASLFFFTHWSLYKNKIENIYTKKHASYESEIN